MDTSDPIYTLGLGTARLAATDSLTQQGQSVVVFVRNSRVSGLAKSIEDQGFTWITFHTAFFPKIASASVLEWDEVLGKEQGTNIKNFTKFYK